MSQHRGHAFHKRAFTLVELMVVVVIVSVLAVLAVVGYQRIVGSSRMAEATGVIQAIRVAQEAYRSETQQYANVSQTLKDTYPVKEDSVGNFKTAWGAACTNCNTVTWADLNVKVDGPVAFGYATVAGTAGDPADFTFLTGKTVVTAAQTSDWFMVRAVGDTNGNGTKCEVFNVSWSNQLIIENEGE